MLVRIDDKGELPLKLEREAEAHFCPTCSSKEAVFPLKIPIWNFTSIRTYIRSSSRDTSFRVASNWDLVQGLVRRRQVQDISPNRERNS
jgi:hypothetical protein